MGKLWSIAVNTFLQTIRQPIYLTLLVVTYGVLVLGLPLADWAISADYEISNQRMLEALGLSTMLVSGLLISVFSASGVVAREIEGRTALTVIAKPVSRTTFILGKFAGVTAAVVLAYYLCGLVYLLTVRHKVMPSVSSPLDMPVIVLGLSAMAVSLIGSGLGNLLFNWQFTSTFVWTNLITLSLATGAVGFIGKGWVLVPFGTDIRAEILVGMVLLLMAVLVLSAVAVTASTRLGQALSLLVCVAVFMAGSVHPFLFERHADEAPLLRYLGWLAPNLALFYPLDALTLEKDIPLDYVALAAGYCALYVAGVLAIGVALFHRRSLDAGTQTTSMPGPVALLAWTGRAAAVALALAGGAIASQPRLQNLAGLTTAGGLVVAGVICWLLWGFFARGARWSYWLVLVPAVLILVGSGAAVAYPMLEDRLPALARRVPPGLTAILAAAVVLLLVLPKTRRHFKSQIPAALS